MILAAGRGERLRPLTDTVPKPLLDIGGKTLIEVHLEKLSNAGFREVVINLAHHGEMIRESLGDGSRWGLHLNYSREPEGALDTLSLIHISEPTRLVHSSRMPSSA